jgi:hypothetical protein
MRYMILGFAAALAVSAAPAQAVENFIPLGQNYAPGDDQLPPLGSEQDKVNAQVDIYETEIYNRALREKEFSSRMYNLSNEQNPDTVDENDLDY